MWAVSSKVAESPRSERNPAAANSAQRAGTAIEWRMKRGLTLIPQMVRDRGDDHVAAEQEGALDEERALVVEQVVPPARRHELGEEHGDEVLGALLVRDLDVLEQRLHDRAEGRGEDLEA